MESKKSIIFEAIVTTLFSVLISSIVFTITEMFTKKKK